MLLVDQEQVEFSTTPAGGQSRLQEQADDSPRGALMLLTGEAARDFNLMRHLDCPGALTVPAAAGGIPPHDEADRDLLEAIAWAVASGVRDLVVCGHSRGRTPAGPTPAKRPAAFLERVCKDMGAATARLREVQQGVLQQLENLRTYPAVMQALRKEAIRLHAWVYLEVSGMFLTYDARQGGFIPLAEALDSPAA